MNPSHVFKALGDEKRLAMLLSIASHNDICACHLIDKFGVSQSTLSHHLAILADANLVTTRKEGKWIHYTLNRDTLKELENTLDTLVHIDGEKPKDCC